MNKMKVCSTCQKCYDDSTTTCDFENHKILTETGRQGDCFLVEGYKIDKQIQPGSPIELYKATHLATEKYVLIRIIKANDLTAELQNEVRLAAGVNHPNLARVFEFGCLEDGDFYVVLEDLEGGNLKESLEKSTTFSERQAIKITRQIAEGLEQLHNAGVLHRNISPANICFTNSENHNFEVKLQNYDFGGVVQNAVVKGANGIDAKTEIFRYFSSEQFADKKVDFKSDLYSLAVVFYEMLLGRTPYDSYSSQAIADYVFDESDLKELHHDLRALLAYTLRESLQQRLKLRPRSTNNLVRQLRHLELIATPTGIINQETLPSPAKANQPTYFLGDTIDEENIIDGENLITESVDYLESVKLETKHSGIQAKSSKLFELAKKYVYSNGSESKADDLQASEIITESEIETKTDDEPIKQKPEIPKVVELPANSHFEEEDFELFDSEEKKSEKLFADKESNESDENVEFEAADKIELNETENISDEVFADVEDFDEISVQETYFDEYVDSDDSEFLEEETVDELDKQQITMNSFGAYAQTNPNLLTKTYVYKNYIYTASIIAVVLFGGLFAANMFERQDDAVLSQAETTEVSTEAKIDDSVQIPSQEAEDKIQITPDDSEENSDSLDSSEENSDSSQENIVGETDETTSSGTSSEETLKNNKSVISKTDKSSPKNVKENKELTVKNPKATKENKEPAVKKETVAQKHTTERKSKQTDALKENKDTKKQKTNSKKSDEITRPRVVSDVRIHY